MQDHTKGKKITYTPQVTLYGDNKKSPHFYKSMSPEAEGVHTWVSSYADYFGYGYWNPDEYYGAGVHQKGYYVPQVGKDNYMLSRYGIGKREHHDGMRHEGDLAKIGVATGANGKGYSTEGKWRKGDQVVQVQQDDKGTVMRRRTITTGGKLTGAAHIPSSKETYGGPKAYGGKGSYGAVDDMKSVSAGGYGGYGHGGYGGYGHAGRKTYGGSHGGYGKRSYGHQRYTGPVQFKGIGYGTASHSHQPTKYGGYGLHGAIGGGSFGFGKTNYSGYHSVQPFKAFSGLGHGHGGYERYGSMNKHAGEYGKKAVGTFGNPYTKYTGPGLHYLHNPTARFDPILGKGIVLGKYTRSTGDTKRYTDYDHVEVAGPNSNLYKDALDLIKMNGTQNVAIDSFKDAEDAKIVEDIPEAYDIVTVESEGQSQSVDLLKNEVIDTSDH